MNPIAWVLKLKSWAIELGLLVLAILSGAIYEREKGKREGMQQEQAKSAQQVIKAIEVKNAITSEVEKQTPGSAEQALKKEWSRD